jgi:hypothetical protein
MKSLILKLFVKRRKKGKLNNPERIFLTGARGKYF